jgi:hypothetical protein
VLAKFAEPEAAGEDFLHEGFATTAADRHGADHEWVCVECFALFRKEVGWTEVTAGPPIVGRP